jgi:LmbE family N-acetylglucosaminyl deacetylase
MTFGTTVLTRRLLAFLALALFAGFVFGGPLGRPAEAAVNLQVSAFEPATTGGLTELDRALAKLTTHKRVLVIGAHPDDEDTSLLALVSRGWGGEAAYLSLSRGDGGQNLLGPELGVGLGLIRSRELLAARSVDGGRQYFTRAFDFGFTNSLEETFGLWPKDVLNEDAVRIMRRFRPQVVVSVFPGKPSPTHGQHQAAGVTAFAAFPLSGDPSAMPQLQSEGLSPWTPLALYRSVYFDPTSATVVMPIGQIDPLTGKSVYQLAVASRSMHRSQSMGRVQDLGTRETRVAWEKGGAGVEARDLFAGIDTHLHAMAATIATAALRDKVAAELDAAEELAVKARAALNPTKLEDSVPTLVNMTRRLAAARALLGAPDTKPADPAAAAFIDEKLEVAHLALAAAVGVAVDATTAREAVIPGDHFDVAAQLWNSGHEHLTDVGVTLVAAPEWHAPDLQSEAKALTNGELGKWTLAAHVPAGTPATVPYFLRRPLQGSLYDWSDATPAERGEPFGPPPLTARFHFTVEGIPVVVQREVVHLHRDEELGEIRRPLRVVPRLEVTLGESVLVWPLSRREARNVRVVVTSHARAPLGGTVQATLDPPIPGFPAIAPVRFDIPAAEDDEGETVSVALTLPAPAAAGRHRILVTAQPENGEAADLAVPLIDYEHIRPTPFPHRSVIDLTAADIKVPKLHHVGYVRGASDRVPDYLRQIGIPVELLGPADLASGHFEHFDAIVIGSRAYETDSNLARANPRLLDYVRNGGLLIVQYQQYPFIEGGFAPAKLEMARPAERVTDETAAVHVLEPAHPVFTTPNKIGEADWQGWVQERGLYFPHAWDPVYKPLLEMADPGGPELKGSLLVANVGKGHYVLTSLALFRQLPAGVPGAYRLFANLLALH